MNLFIFSYRLSAKLFFMPKCLYSWYILKQVHISLVLNKSNYLYSAHLSPFCEKEYNNP